MAGVKRVMGCRFHLLLLSGILLAGRSVAAEPDEEDESSEVSEIIVSASRSHRLVRDQAVRVEVVPQEELEESRTVAPGNLTNLLNELPGARMEVGSAGLGSTSLRLRGMPGRHAQILFDGLALAGAQPGSFSLLQSPPIDLQRVELIKGAASALYGGSGLAGVLNLVSRAPGAGSEWLLSQTSAGGTDADLFYDGGGDAGHGFTLTGSAHYQSRRDFDGDGWAELPGFERFTARPRWHWGDSDHDNFATLGVSGENRNGGTTGNNTLPGAAPFDASLDTRHVDAGWTSSITREDGDVVGVKLSGTWTQHEQVYGGPEIDDAATNLFAETTYQGKFGDHDWTLGAAFQYDDLSVPDVRGVGHLYTTPAIFAQDEYSPKQWFALSASVRVDAHSEFGTIVSPRISALFRFDPDVSLRASVGTGFAPATPLVDEVEEVGFGRLDPLQGVRDERASSASLDFHWYARPFDINLSAFGSDLRHPLDVEASSQPDRIRIVNDDGEFRVRGAEMLVGCVIGDAHLLASATWLDATEESTSRNRQRAELIPEFAGEVAAIFEFEGRGRAGFEISYTGPQAVHDDPYRMRTPSLLEVNALAEITFGKIAVFANAFNLTDEKQSDSDPVLWPAGTAGLGGNPVTPAWASMVGRYFSVGLRSRF